MRLKVLFPRNFATTFRVQSALSKRCFASDTKEIEVTDITSADEVPSYVEESAFTEEEIALKRNKSRLRPADRNFLFERRRYDESQAWYHDTVRYKKRLLGRYGMEAMGVHPGAAWPLPDEVEYWKEYERVRHPITIQEEIENIAKNKIAEAEAIKAREAEIEKKVGKLKQWKNDLAAKIAQREALALAAKERKERMVEEIRRHFGFKMDPRDERFKAMLEKKEKEDKKKRKESKKQERYAKYLEHLAQMNANAEAEKKAEGSSENTAESNQAATPITDDEKSPKTSE